MDEEISIDINVTKLLEWLISRRHCNKNWQSQIAEIREKINSALIDMPENKLIAQLLSGSYINYFTCCKIIEILKETEADSKNVFGRYGSKRMKDWQEIVRLYQVDNVYLAELSNILLRNIKFEIPSIKKQLSKYRQMEQDFEKKISDYAKSALSAQKDLEMTKKQLGIASDNVRVELLKRTLSLDIIYTNIVSSIKTLEKAVEYYTNFTNYLAGTKYSLPLITHIIEKGNTTVYEWRYGELPDKIEKNKNIEELIQAEKNEVTDEIDWNIDVEEAGEGDYGITITDIEESGIELELNESDEKIARGYDAHTILDNPITRDDFFSQVLELYSFLKMRLVELQKDSGLFSMNQSVQESVENIEKMLLAVDTVKKSLSDPTNQQLHFIKHSDRYIDKVTSSFKQKINLIEKMIASREAVKYRKEESKNAEENLKPILKSTIEKTRQLQEEIEAEISKKYNNRPVNLMGVI